MNDKLRENWECLCCIIKYCCGISEGLTKATEIISNDIRCFAGIEPVSY